ncbi:MAG: GFA family protein [Proteobacteria bacterium]|nr:GFA family protein [Pseudomonadota bacterium]MCH9026503.1 GFA family protein [Pseudomonadota bacterium]
MRKDDFKKNAVKSIEGPLKSFRHISDASGRWLDIQFCERCGSSITWTLELVPGWRGFEGGSFDDCSVFPRKVHMWTDSCHPPVQFSKDDICFPRQPPFKTEQHEAM